MRMLLRLGVAVGNKVVKFKIAPGFKVDVGSTPVNIVV